MSDIGDDETSTSTSMLNTSPSYSSVVDHGGEREVLSTGATREKRIGKGRFDLLPPYPLKRLAQHYENGAIKYADRNWEKGLPLSRFFNSAISHLNEFADGNRDEDHLAAAMWNIAGYMHIEREVVMGRLPAELNDVP